MDRPIRNPIPALGCLVLLCTIACASEEDAEHARPPSGLIDEAQVRDAEVREVPEEGPERSYWFDASTPVSREGRLYQFRRNNASLVAWASRLRSRESGRHVGATENADAAPRRVLVHMDAHSDAHPARLAPDGGKVRGLDRDAVERYAALLPISSFVMPALHYGWIDEVYWIQPPTDAFRGAPESYSFDLAEVDGEIRPIRTLAGSSNPSPGPRADAEGRSWESESRRILEGERVGRAFELGYAYDLPVGAWSGDRYRLHLVSSSQFDSLLGTLPTGTEWVFDVDLDYFGSAGALRGYGLLAWSGTAPVAAGSRGGILPVFALDDEECARELSRLRRWFDVLDPVVVSVSESPDHSFRDRLPRLASQVRSVFRSGTPPDAVVDGAGAPGGGGTDVDTHTDTHVDDDIFAGSVDVLTLPSPGSSEPSAASTPSAHSAPRPVRLDPACETWIDLGVSDSLVFELTWRDRWADEPRFRDDRRSPLPKRNAPESLEVSVYFDPVGARDHLAARWTVEMGPGSARLSVPFPAEGSSSLLGSGWDIEIRRNEDGLLLWTSAFALERDGALLRDILGDSLPGFERAFGSFQGMDEVDRDARSVADETVSSSSRSATVTPLMLRNWAREEGWPPERIHRLLLAHPSTYDAQCEVLARIRSRSASR